MDKKETKIKDHPFLYRAFFKCSGFSARELEQNLVSLKSVTSTFRRTSTFYTHFRTGRYIDPPLSVLYNSNVKYVTKREYGFAMFLKEIHFFPKG